MAAYSHRRATICSTWLLRMDTCRAAHQLLCLSLQQCLQVIGSSNMNLMQATNIACALPARFWSLLMLYISRLLQGAS